MMKLQNYGAIQMVYKLFTKDIQVMYLICLSIKNKESFIPLVMTETLTYITF